ncbi:MAG: S-methyl-5-thioribose-1-phosphate isomerase [Thermofilum sp. ex4484_15]|nr:MAG: S-methyl-5-thioribose-1-phosphate isomerase [Thermofilum sp. ex4484_15]
MLNLPRTIEWVNGKVRFINQLSLPERLEFIITGDYRRLIKAIKDMEIRGAPAIGVAAAFTIALASLRFKDVDVKEALNFLSKVCEEVKRARPTAYNLFWALNRLMKVAKVASSIGELKELVVKEALKIAKEDEEVNKKIGEVGEKLLKDGSTVITVCNAGSLATTYYGTATAPIYKAFESGKRIRVIVMETRPYLQGARLTAFELKVAGIPVKLITDNSIGIVTLKEKIDIALVGADRITKEGYVINKIGTYPLALVCRERNIPFYVVAPTSTIDPRTPLEKVTIEKRPSDEVVYFMGKRIAPEGVEAIYYAFDITPPELITGIITERGILRPPYRDSIGKLLKSYKI